MQLSSPACRRHVIGSAAACAGVLGLLAGCTPPQPEPTPIVVQNQSTWAMPLDEFKVFDPSLSNYAEQLLIAKCLEGQGYEWPVPWQDTDFAQTETVNDSALKIFNLDIARRFGYHDAPPPNPADVVAWTEFTTWANAYDPDEQVRSRFDGCGEDARSDKTVAAADGLNYIASLEIQARDEVSSMDAVRDAARMWRSCLSEFVTFELPNDPWGEMPTLEMAQQYGIYGHNLTEVASPDELSAAEADARCRDSSGYTEARYRAEWSAQETLVTNNRDKLDRIRDEAVAHTDELKTLIAQNAPTR